MISFAVCMVLKVIFLGIIYIVLNIKLYGNCFIIIIAGRAQQGRGVIPKGRWSEGSLVRRVVGPKGHWSEITRK